MNVLTSNYSLGDNVKIEPNLPSGANEFLYVESKRARMDREKVGN